MIPKDYIDIQIQGNQFFIVHTEQKEKPTESALNTLQSIEKVMKENLSYNSAMNDEFSQLDPDKLHAKLKEMAATIKDQYMEKASHLSFFRRFFGGISKKEKEIQQAYTRIENLQSPPTFNLDPDSIRNIYKFLGVQDIASVEQVSKLSGKLTKASELERAKAFGFKGNDNAEARKYLANLFNAIKRLSKNTRLLNDLLVKKGTWPFNHLDIEATIKNIQSLIKDEPYLINGFETYIKDALGFSKDYYDGNDLALKNVGAICAISHILDTNFNREFRSAIIKGREPKVIQTFIENGADVNETALNNGYTPLMFAVDNNPETIPLLLNAGANVNAVDKMGGTALMDAAIHHPESIPLLLDAGAKVNIANQDGYTALLYAAKNHPEAIPSLLVAGADVKAVNNQGETALMLAAKNNFKGIPPLLAADADVDAADKFGFTPLMFAAVNQPAGIEPLLGARANINVVDNEGRTALFHVIKEYIIAVDQSKTDLADRLRKSMRLLMDKGADIYVITNDGKSAAEMLLRHVIG